MRVQHNAPEGALTHRTTSCKESAFALAGSCLPRRKYGHMVKAIPPLKEEKCRYCRLGLPCPVHKKK